MKGKEKITLTAVTILLSVNVLNGVEKNSEYIIVDTGQNKCYDNSDEISCPNQGKHFYGQDAQYEGIQPSYQDNGDGTVNDLNTGLMWQQDPGDKMSYDEAVAGASSFDLAGYNDWRLPTIKELYSLILFSGDDPSGCESELDCPGLVPFIDTDYFDFSYGNTSAGERLIDAQYISSTEYVGENMEGHTVFGVNFADGRIKGYGTGPMPGQTEDKQFFVLYVRGNADYDTNNFVDNGNGTITDNATGLMWQQDDSQTGMVWEDALSYAEDLELAGYSDWRLPNAKELQSIVDYTRSPSTTSSAAIDPLFNATAITNEAGNPDYPFYWTSTTHENWATGGNGAVYIAFGRALGYMNNSWIDVHGAGAQRSDPKTGDPGDYPYGHGPQGDAIRIYNYVRCVRGGNVSPVGVNEDYLPNMISKYTLRQNYPNPFNWETHIAYTLNVRNNVQIQIHNIVGRLVRSFDMGIQEPGAYSVNWDGTYENGAPAKSGVYFYCIKAGNKTLSKSMILLMLK